MRLVSSPFFTTAALVAPSLHSPMSMTEVHQNQWLYSTRHPKPRRDCETDQLAVVVLNSRGVGECVLTGLWESAVLRMCADGGANRLFDSLDEEKRLLPDLIKGDLDSLRPEVAAFYESRGCTLLQDPNQDTNDFEKCLEEVQGGKEVTVVALGAFGGRFDQEMAAFNMLHRYANRFKRYGLRCVPCSMRPSPPTHSLVLVGDGNLSMLLGPGRHVIKLHPELEGPICGLIPLGGPCQDVTTTGLKWNLEHQKLRFGELVSSSNSIAAESVGIETDAPLIWTVEL
ncbi:unnamed protein product, partial [Chrysoparadoxa australica]